MTEILSNERENNTDLGGRLDPRGEDDTTPNGESVSRLAEAEPLA